MADRNDRLTAEVRALRERVVGVTDVVVASADGLLITADTGDAESADSLAALTAAALGVARRAGSLTGKGLLHHTTARYTDGFLVAQAVGEMALLGVLGDAGLDVRRLHLEAQRSADRIGDLLTADSPVAAAN
ncbi:roadblock/LC7 domain-containing protein [Kitasatospora sp. NPDC058965]|uniref:roadblock/LC7 domain-containing protein n=1 Tax=Kitasatospora sp. NPDC058965 TaxID=3346682 RepID=UPI0036C03CB6